MKILDLETHNKEMEKFKKLLRAVEKDIPFSLITGFKKEIFKDDQLVQKLVESKVITEIIYEGKSTYTLTPESHSLIATWQTLKLTRRIMYMTFALLVLTVILLFVT